MNKLAILISLSLTTDLLKAGAVKQENIQSAVNIAAEVQLTDANRVVIPQQVLNLRVGQAISLKRSDGFEYKGVVKEIEEEDGLYKVFGVMLNAKKTRFGFIATKQGQFVGAIVDEDSSETYLMEFFPAAKGYIFVKELIKKDKSSGV